MKFDGLVLYSPTPEEKEKLIDILETHLKSRPKIEEIASRYTKKKFFSTKYDYAAIEIEVKNLSFGWDWDCYKMMPFESRVFYSYPKDYIDSISTVSMMLSINTECYITPEQSRAIFNAFKDYERIVK